MQKITIKVLCRVAILIALEIVLSRLLSFNTLEVKIGFGFVPIAICGFLYGPAMAAIAAALSDFLGSIILPIGPYFVGFTLTAALVGLSFGLFLHRKDVKFFPHIFLCALINCAILSLCLNTYWVTFLTGNPYSIQLLTRLPQFGISFAFQLALLPLLKNIAYKLKRDKI